MFTCSHVHYLVVPGDHGGQYRQGGACVAVECRYLLIYNVVHSQEKAFSRLAAARGRASSGQQQVLTPTSPEPEPEPEPEPG